MSGELRTRNSSRHSSLAADIGAWAVAGQYSHRPRGSAMNDAAKKTVLRHFPYGLYALTVAHGGEGHRMTANWVLHASVDPATVVVAVAKKYQEGRVINPLPPLPGAQRRPG